MFSLHHLSVLLHFLLFDRAFSKAIVLRQTEERLIYVQAVWRHGDRAPHQLPYPNDLNDERSWPRGWSQLTNV